MLPIDILVPGYEIDTREINYSFWKKDRRTLPDFADKFGGAFFVSERAFITCRKMFEAHGRAFEVSVDALRYFIVLIDVLINGFDFKKSVYRTFGGNDPELKDKICLLEEIWLRPDFSTNADIFRLKGPLIIENNIIVSDHFKDVYHSNNLVGLLFQPVKLSKTPQVSELKEKSLVATPIMVEATASIGGGPRSTLVSVRTSPSSEKFGNSTHMYPVKRRDDRQLQKSQTRILDRNSVTSMASGVKRRTTRP